MTMGEKKNTDIIHIPVLICTIWKELPVQELLIELKDIMWRLGVYIINI